MPIGEMVAGKLKKPKNAVSNIDVDIWSMKIVYIALLLFLNIMVVYVLIVITLVLLKCRFPSVDILHLKLTDVRIWFAFSMAFMLGTLISGFALACIRKSMLKNSVGEINFQSFFLKIENIDKVVRPLLGLTLLSGIITNGFIFANEMASQQVFSMGTVIVIYSLLTAYACWVVSDKVYLVFMRKTSPCHKGTYRHRS